MSWAHIGWLEFQRTESNFIKDKFVTTTLANQVSNLTISIVIFDVDTCHVVLYVLYWYVWIVYESIWLWYDCWGLLRVSLILANLENDHGFISRWIHLHWYEACWGNPKQSKAKPWELMLKVDNIISLWRVVIPNMVSKRCPKLSHDNRILKYRTKIVSLKGVVILVTKVSNKGCTLFKGSRKMIRAMW